MKTISVTFPNKEVENNYEKLEKSTNSQERELFKHITNAIANLKKHPEKGIKLPKRLWPKEYIQQYAIDSLWKLNLPGGWRLIYTIKTNNITIFAIILEWLKHKNYEERFNYKKQ